MPTCPLFTFLLLVFPIPFSVILSFCSTFAITPFFLCYVLPWHYHYFTRQDSHSLNEIIMNTRHINSDILVLQYDTARQNLSTDLSPLFSSTRNALLMLPQKITFAAPHLTNSASTNTLKLLSTTSLERTIVSTATNVASPSHRSVPHGSLPVPHRPSALSALEIASSESHMLPNRSTTSSNLTTNFCRTRHSRGRHGAGQPSVDRFRRSNQAMVY